VNFHKEKPILIGRLNRLDAETMTLTGHLGNVVALSNEEYKILKLMNGFSTFEELAKKHNKEIKYITEVYQKYQGDKKLTLLSNWNIIGWCNECKVYVSGDKCGLCGGDLSKIVFAPPCDPWICLDEEREFIVKVLKEKFDIQLPKDIFLLANNGVENNVFFWEIAYKDRIIMKIVFSSIEESNWKYQLLTTFKEIRDEEWIVFNDKTIQKTIIANKKRQEILFKNSSAFIKEQCSLFKTKPLIYFSGGKESMVMYSLFSRLGIEANVLTVAPGAEFPDDLEFMLEFKKNIEADENFNYYFYQSDGNRIIEALNSRKVLSAKDPWCRIDFKKELKNIGTKEIYKGDDFIACEGSRWYENDFRRRHPKVNFISGYQHQLWIHPIAEWTSFDIWIYMFTQSLPINPVYYKGFQRTTCWMCPIVNPFHLSRSKKYYPELWEKIKDCRLEAFGDDNSQDLPY
jgi:3'-phosphoadenosine 5'-phosphosulfate sulfotransferase (PAPS reductase)/FAD synthetase